MRGDDRQLQLRGERDGLLNIGLAARVSRPLQLDVKRIREQLRPALCVTLRCLVVTGGERHADVSMLRA